MKAILELELWAGASESDKRFWHQLLKSYSVRGVSPPEPCPLNSWVAEITGFSNRYKYNRVYLKGKVDVSRMNKRGTKGIYLNYILDSDHFYEVKDGIRAHYFCRVDETGEIAKVAEKEVIAWLKSRSGSTCLRQRVSE